VNTKRQLSYAKNVKIFNKNNPNIKILNTDESIISLFKDNPIPVEYCKTPEENEIIGFVSGVGEFVGTELLGDVTFWGQEYSNYEFKNYCVEIDGQTGNNKEYFVSRVVCVEFQPPVLEKAEPAKVNKI
jgi:hypothetical protein